MGLPVRFPAPDSQCQGRGCMNSGWRRASLCSPKNPSDSPKVQALGITPASGIEKSLNSVSFDGQRSIVLYASSVPSGSSAQETGQLGGRRIRTVQVGIANGTPLLHAEQEPGAMRVFSLLIRH